MHSRGIIGAAALLSSLAVGVAAADLPTDIMGFNYGNIKNGGEARTKDDYLLDFKNAKELAGANGKFNSARLYTMIQKGTETDPNEAIDAAIDTDTSLLLGIWASAGSESFEKEITALSNAIEKHGEKFTKLVIGLSIGSEDLYRSSPTGVKNNSPVGADVDTILKYIKQAKDSLKDTPLASVPIGHVDTADVWVDGASKSVIEAVDWIGFDAYPYFEGTRDNKIENAGNLFFQGYNKTEKVAGGKPIWITETGWPISGKTERDAIPNVENAKKFWDQIGCRVLGRINTWWYILEDEGATPSFGISEKGTSKPLFDLDCSNVKIDWTVAAPQTGDNTTSPSSSGGSSSSSGGSSTSSGSKPSGSNSANGQNSGASYTKGLGVSALMLVAGVAAFLV